MIGGTSSLQDPVQAIPGASLQVDAQQDVLSEIKPEAVQPEAQCPNENEPARQGAERSKEKQAEPPTAACLEEHRQMDKPDDNLLIVHTQAASLPVDVDHIIETPAFALRE